MSGRCRQRLSLVCSHTESVVDSCSCLAHVIEVVLNCSPNDVVPKLKDGLGRLMGALRCPAGPHVGGFRIYLSFYNVNLLTYDLIGQSGCEIYEHGDEQPPMLSKWLHEAPIEHIVFFLCTVCWKISLGALGLQVEVCRFGRAAEDSSKWHPDLYFPGRIEASWSLSHRPQAPRCQIKFKQQSWVSQTRKNWCRCRPCQPTKITEVSSASLAKSCRR